ncbi:MAG: PHP domain-containing protein, partial [Maricaulaceae bacterium]
MIAALVCATNFSFLRGASHPDEMVLTAQVQGYGAVGIADRNTLAGVVRAHVAAKEAGMKVLIGARLVTQDGFEVAAFPQDRAAYARLTRLLTLGNRRAPKGECWLSTDDILAHAEGQALILIPPAQLNEAWKTQAEAFARALHTAPEKPAGIWTGMTRGFSGGDGARLHRLAQLGEAWRAPGAAIADALYHAPDRRPLQDVLTCVREKTTIDAAGRRLEMNAERHLKPPAELARLFAEHPEAVARTAEIAAAVDFSLSELAYQYPDEILNPGETPIDTLTR